MAHNYGTIVMEKIACDGVSRILEIATRERTVDIVAMVQSEDAVLGSRKQACCM